MEISIAKTDVYDFARALTSRAGAVSDRYEQIAITEDNYPMLDIYLSSAINHAESGFKKKLDSSTDLNLTYNQDSLSIVLSYTARIRKSVYGLIRSSIRLYMAYYIAASWIQSVSVAGLAEVYAATAAAHLDTAVSSIAQKKTEALNESAYDMRCEDNITADFNTNGNADYEKRQPDTTIFNPCHLIEEGKILTIVGIHKDENEELASAGNSDFLITKS